MNKIGIMKRLKARFKGEGYFLDFYKKASPCFSSGVLTVSFDLDGRRDYECLASLYEVFAADSFPVSLALTGALAAEFKPYLKNILRDPGVEILNHTYSHPEENFAGLSPERLKEEILLADEVLSDLAEKSIRGFRAPHFMLQHTERIYPVLSGAGYLYSSSTLSTAVDSLLFRRGGVYEIPLTPCIRHPFSVFDSWHIKKMKHHDIAEFYALFDKMLETACDNKKYINLYFDTRDMHSSEASVLCGIIRGFVSSGGRVMNYAGLLGEFK